MFPIYGTANILLQSFMFSWFFIVTVFFFMTSDQFGYSRIVSPLVGLQQPQCVPLWSFFRPRLAGLSCRPSVRARGTWSTVHFATERCPCLSSSPWWTAPCSSARRGTTRSSTTFRATFKVRLAQTFGRNLFTVLRSSRCGSISCFECVSIT